MKDRRINHNINLLKILACFAVIILHTSSEHLFKVPYGSYESIVMNIGNGITRFAVTTFFLITGSLYLSENYHIDDYNKYFRKVGRFILLYFIYAFLYSACALLFSRQFNHDMIKNIIMIIDHGVKNPKYHLWYLPVYVGVLLGIPLLKRFLYGSDKNDKKLIGFATLLVMINMIPKSLKPFGFSGIEVFNDIFKKFMDNTFAGWIGVCLIGYYISKYSLRNYKAIYTIVLTFFILAMIASYHYCGRIETLFYENLTLQTTLYASVVFDFVVNHLEVSFSDRAKTIIKYVSSLTLGIYLIHPLVLNVFEVIGFNSLSFSSAIAILMVSIVTFFISAVIISVVKKIPVIGKILV